MGAFQTAVTPYKTAMMQSAESNTAWLREQIEQRDWEEAALAAFRARLQRAERDAVRLYFELRKMVGTQESVLQLALQALGVSLDVAQRAVGAYQNAAQGDELDEQCRARLVERGWTVIAPGKDASTNGGGKDAEGTQG